MEHKAHFCLLAKFKGLGSKVVILPWSAQTANLGERVREIHVFFHRQGKSTLNPKLRPGMWQDFTVKLVWEGAVVSPDSRVLGLAGFPNQVFTCF